MTPCANDLEAVKTTLAAVNGVFGVMIPDGDAYVLSVSSNTPLEKLEVAGIAVVDVTVVHGLVLDGMLGIDAAKLASESHVDYIKAERDVVPKLSSGRYQFGCILPPPDPRRVAEVAAAGQRMPQKALSSIRKYRAVWCFHHSIEYCEGSRNKSADKTLNILRRCAVVKMWHL